MRDENWKEINTQRSRLNKYQYTKFHWIVRVKFGDASKCENPDCIYPRKSKGNRNILLAPKRYDWALKSGHTYSDNIDDYLQLCRSCHRKYDLTDEIKKEIQKRRLKGKNHPSWKGGKKRRAEWAKNYYKKNPEKWKVYRKTQNEKRRKENKINKKTMRTETLG